MKIQGQEVTAPPIEEIVVIPRGGDKDIVFKAKMIDSYENFDLICPVPVIPSRMEKGGQIRSFPNDKDYLKALDDWAINRAHWMFLTSLEPTEIEWTTVDMSKPDTWTNYEKELTDAGFSQVELMRVMQIIQDANGLNQSKIDEATARFLATKQEQPESGDSPTGEQNSTQSGSPANVSD